MDRSFDHAATSDSTPVFLASSISSAPQDPNAETYFLLPFSTISTTDRDLNVFGGTSTSNAIAHNVFNDEQAITALPIDSFQLITASNLLSSVGVPVVDFQNVGVPVAEETDAATTSATSEHVFLVSAPVNEIVISSDDIGSQGGFPPSGFESSNQCEIDASGEETSSGPLEEPSASGLGCVICGFQAENDTAFRRHQQLWNDKRHYRCNLCDFVFDQVDMLTAHEKQCRVSKPFRCHCGEMFNREINYTIHLATHDLSGKELRCPLCQDLFKRVASYRCHLKLHAVDDVVTCTVCEEDFSTNVELQQHIQSSHVTAKTAPTNICKQCGAVFKRPLELAEHMITHKKIRETLRTCYRRKRRTKTKNSSDKYTCDTCLKSFDRKSTFDRHVLIHTGERPFICKICKKSFNQKGALMFHEAKHLPQKPHKCQLCGAGFSQRGNLRTHVKRVHPATMADCDTMLECPMCSCWFKSSQSLQVHLSRRHNERMSAIGDMNVIMDKVQQPEGSSSSHSPLFTFAVRRGRRPAKTTIDRHCSSKFNNHPMEQQSLPGTESVQSANLPLPKVSIHPSIRQVTTNSHRSWQCEVCNKTFAKLSDATRHIRMHTGDRPFACNYCPLHFAVKSTLEKHIRSKHLRIKSARCYVCWKELSSSFSLSKHLRIHARETVDCDKCSRTFRTMADLRFHETKAHYGAGTAVGEKERIAELHKANLREPLLETELGVVELAKKGSATDTRTLPLVDETGKLERPYQCSSCPMRFKKPSHLEEHTRYHQNSRPYICRFGNCRRKFFTASALRDHAVIHSGAKRHICDVCKKAFLVRRSLTRHMFVHSDPSVRPFICPYCGKRFKRGVLCRQHIKTHKSDSTVAGHVAVECSGSGGATVERIAGNLPTEYHATGIAAERGYGGAEDAPATYGGICGIVQDVSGCAPMVPETARPDVRQLQDPATGSYLSSDAGFSAEHPPANMFPAELPPASMSFIAWDSIGQNLAAIDGSSSSELLPPPESVLQTPDITANHSAPLLADSFVPPYPTLHATPTVVCDPRASTFQNDLQLEPHPANVHRHRESNCNLQTVQLDGQSVYQGPSAPVLGLPVMYQDPSVSDQFVGSSAQSTSESQLPRQWNQASRQLLCPECGESFERANHLCRHVYEAHPSQPAFPTTTNWDVLSQQGTTCTQPPKQLSSAHVGGGQAPVDAASSGYEARQRQPTLNMTGQIPVSKINSRGHVWNFSTVEPLVEHQPIMSSDGKVRFCPCCGKSFKKPCDLIRHIRVHTDERPYVCECGRGFKTKTSLNTHKQTHETNRPIMHRCQVCNKIFASLGALKVHLRQHTNEKRARCPHCSKEYRSPVLLNQHLLKMHGVDTNQPAVAMSYPDLRNAQPLRSGGPSAFSQVTPSQLTAVQTQLLDTDRLALILTYNNNHELELNVRRWTPDYDSTQNAGVIVEVGFLRNLAAQGSTLAIPINCDGAAAETSITVDPNLLLAQGSRAVAQPVSGETSMNQSLSNTTFGRIPEPPTPSAYLTTFPSTEIPDHDFGIVAGPSLVGKTAPVASEPSFIVECKVCDLKFSNMQESRIHFQSPDHETALAVQRETDGPSHLCEMCGKLFATRERLLRHIRGHTGERPFQCTVCGECFTQTNSLKKHYMSKHTNIRPFACPVCDRQFTLKYNMETHIRRIHGRAGPNENVVAVEAEDSRPRVRTYLLSL